MAKNLFKPALKAGFCISGAIMDINKYRVAFHSQKSHAAARGIEFRLTFVEWCEFWGEDIDKRGCGPGNLQMQRHADTGPYAIANIRKGTPKQNSATFRNMQRKRDSEKSAAELQIELDAAMNSDSMPEFDKDGVDPHIHNMGMKSSYAKRYDFVL